MAAAGPQEFGTPSNTVYIHNLNEKVKKNVLKKSLHSIFTQFGRIVEIVACRGLRLRGQAWVVFDDQAAAITALKQMQGFPFYDKPMRIEFAKSKSDIIARRDGTFVQREKRPREAPPQGGKKKAAAGPPGTGAGAAQPAGAGAAAPVGAVAPSTGATTQASAARAPPAAPNNILFAQQLPAECTQAMLTMLFQQYRGLREVRMVPGGMAFVEFEDIALATLALQGLAGFKLTQQDTLHLSFAKK